MFSARRWLIGSASVALCLAGFAAYRGMGAPSRPEPMGGTLRSTSPRHSPAPSRSATSVPSRASQPEPPRELSGDPEPESALPDDERPEPVPTAEDVEETAANAAAPQPATPIDHPVVAAELGEPPVLEPAAHPAPGKPSQPRQVDLSLLVRWQRPGICAHSEAAAAAHQTLLTRFRRAEGPGGTPLYLDPRLTEGAELPALGYLQEAETVLQAELGLSPGLPDVFLYQDVELLLAAACTNADVVAYYDGALHAVATRADLRESVLHEFTHHALMTSGILGPAWAQEGIAMHVARETWWRRREQLERVAERPFSLVSMETTIPYTLETDQAVLFYVQAAAMVECATRDRKDGLGGLVRELSRRSGELLSYDLPALADPRAFRACVDSLLGS